MPYPDTRIENGVASIIGDNIAIDFGARIIFCKVLGVFEIIDHFTPKQEIIAKVKSLITRLEAMNRTV
jgi:hypothetical protein